MIIINLITSQCLETGHLFPSVWSMKIMSKVQKTSGPIWDTDKKIAAPALLTDIKTSFSLPPPYQNPKCSLPTILPSVVWY